MTEENKLGGFDFALQMMKKGERVARVGWNPHTRAFAAEQPNGHAEVLPYIIMKTADNKILMGWRASQTDMLAEDWMVV